MIWGPAWVWGDSGDAFARSAKVFYERRRVFQSFTMLWISTGILGHGQTRMPLDKRMRVLNCGFCYFGCPRGNIVTLM